MKRIAVVLMMALLITGCQGKKKQVFTEEDLEEQIGIKPDVDWIGLYVRAHELDSLKNIAEVTAARNGSPMPALPDSVKALWDEMGAMMLLRNGEKAFDIYDTHREDIENYLRLDFLNYGFITKVYLPYKATISTREEYGEICIAELEKEFAKVQQQLMAAHR